MSILDRAVVFACDFRPRVVGGIAVCPNHGRAGGAPAWLQLGDGVTASTFPAPLSGYGATFDTGDYLIANVVDRYSASSQFWMYFYGLVRSSTGIVYFWQSRDATQPNARGVGFGTTGAVPTLAIAGASGIDQTTGPAANRIQPRELCSWAVNFKGSSSAASSMEYFLNGVNLGSGTVSSDTWNGDSIATGKSMLYGKYWNGAVPAGNTIAGNHIAIAFGDGLITPKDIAEIQVLLRRRVI